MNIFKNALINTSDPLRFAVLPPVPMVPARLLKIEDGRHFGIGACETRMLGGQRSLWVNTTGSGPNIWIWQALWKFCTASGPRNGPASFG